jgi:hypothetical protein
LQPEITERCPAVWYKPRHEPPAALRQGTGSSLIDGPHDAVDGDTQSMRMPPQLLQSQVRLPLGARLCTPRPVSSPPLAPATVTPARDGGLLGQQFAGGRLTERLDLLTVQRGQLRWQVRGREFIHDGSANYPDVLVATVLPARPVALPSTARPLARTSCCRVFGG